MVLYSCTTNWVVQLYTVHPASITVYSEVWARVSKRRQAHHPFALADSEHTEARAVHERPNVHALPTMEGQLSQPRAAREGCHGFQQAEIVAHLQIGQNGTLREGCQRCEPALPVEMELDKPRALTDRGEHCIPWDRCIELTAH